MRVCGIEIRGNEAILTVAETKAQSITHLPIETKKIAFADDDDSNHVKSFFSLIKDFVHNNHIDRIAIKKRGRKGGFAGGPTSFKIEGIIQLLDNYDFISESVIAPRITPIDHFASVDLLTSRNPRQMSPSFKPQLR